MKPKKRLLSLLLCVTMLFSLCPQSVSAEGSVGTACTHEHTDDCYMEVIECVHEHDENCYPKMEDSISENDATPSNAAERGPENCTHICTEESSCMIRTLNCLHEHNEDCSSSPETAAPAEGTEGGDTIQTATDSNGHYEINADTHAIEKVKAMIDALPDVSELEDMDNDELSEVHEKAQDAYDAFETLTDEEQAELSEELAKLRDVLEYLTGLTAFAATAVSYIDRSWDGSKVVSTTKSCTEYTAITSSTTSLSAGWYVVNQNVTFSDCLETNGAVNIILVDGNTLTAEKGICMSGGTLTIYGQTKETGKINAKDDGEVCPAIGDDQKNGGNIIINGGTIEATAGNAAAAIGGSYYAKKATNVTINGGTVTATATGIGAAIGAGYNGKAGNVTINGGTVTAKNTNTSSSSTAASAIGNTYTEKGGKITINGGTVTASTSATGRYWAPAIGRGCMSDSSTIEIEINGGTIHATTANKEASYSIGGNSTFTVNGGNIYADKGISSAQNSDGNAVTLNTITLNGAKANTTVTSVSGVTGYGLNDVKTLDTNKLYFYLPADSSLTSITAGSSYVCNDNLTFYTSHNFSAATCSQAKTCGRCGQTEGGIDSNNHNWSAWTTNNGTHTRTCSYNSSHTESGTCSGGTATCESAAICSTCNTEYEPKKDHNYTYTANAEQHSITESCDQGCNHSATVTLSAPADLTYDGEAKEAVVTGNFKNVTTPTVTYHTEDGNAPTKVGSYTASITVEGKTVSVEFAIAKKSTTATVTVNGTYTYNGTQIKPTNVTVTDGDGNAISTDEYTLSYGENIEAGTGTVTATFDNSDSYTVTNSPVTGTFTIDPKPLTDAMVSVTGEFTYDGDEKSPAVTVTDGDKTLVLDTDYELSGDKTGTAAKTYTLTVSGKGNYGSSVQKTWTISNATLTGISVEQDGTLTYDGDPKTPQVKTTAPDGLTVSFTYCTTENGTYGSMPALTNAGTHRVYYKADAANYEPYYGSFEVTIERKEVTPTVTVAGGSIYTGNALTPAVTVADGGTTIPDSEYKVSYSDNIEVGTATVTVTDKADGNYAIKEATQTFEIAKANMTDKNTTGSAPYGATGEVDLSSLIEQGGKLEITGTTDNDNVLNGDASLDSNTLKFAFNNDAALIDKSASITVTVKDCKNYEDYKILVTVSVTDKQAPTVTANTITQTYSGAALTNAVITGETGGVKGTWSWKEGKAPKNVADSTSNGRTWTVVFTPTDTVKYKAVEATVAVTINPRSVTISGLSVENKTYDGTTNATVTGTAVINGKIGDDDVIVQNGTAAFADKTAGTGKTITFSGYSLTGTDAGNYTLTAQPTATADVAQKSVTVSGVTAVDRAYNGTNTVSLSNGTVDGKVDGDTVMVDLTTATGTMETPDASNNPKSVTVSGVKLTGKDAENYVLSAQPDGVTVNISRIAYTGTTTATGSAKYGSSNTVDLSSLIMSGGKATIGTASDSNGVLNTYTIENDTSLKFSFKQTAAVDDTATVTVNVSDCTNYTDYTLTVTLTVKEKDVPVVKAPTAKILTYNGTMQTLITAGSTTGGTLQYSLDNRTWSAELPKAKDADSYTVYYKVVGNADYADTAVNSIPVTIGKKAVTVEPQSYTITQGNTIPAFTLEYVGLVDGDTLNITTTPAFTCYEADGTTAVSTSTAAGSYTITWTNSDAFHFDSETNYTVTTATTGTLTINAKPNSNNGSSDSGNDNVTYYTLTFETNGGSSIKAVSTAYGKTIDLSGYAPTRSGYDFSGWYSDKGLTNKITKIKLNGNKTVYAGWVIHNPNTGTSNPFTDVSQNDWFYEHVMFVYGNNLMTGTSATTFEPNSSTTRAQIAVIFYRMEGSPAVEGKNNYTDVEYGPGTAWYYNAATWAQQSGIMGGYGDGKFGPNDPVTREQLAAIFYRYAQYKGYDTTQSGMAIREFDDYESISTYAMDAMTWAVNVGIMTGKGNNRLDPQGTATRAEIAAMLHRFIELYRLTPAPVAPTTGSGGNSGGTSGWVQQTGSPKTGDNTNMGLWLFTLCVSAGAMTVLLFLKRREEEERMIMA